MRKRLLSGFTSLALALSALPAIPASAEGEKIKLEVETATAKAGETVTVNLKLTSNPGFGTGDVEVLWDKDVFALKSVSWKSVAPNNGSNTSTATKENTGMWHAAFGDSEADESFEDEEDGFYDGLWKGKYPLSGYNFTANGLLCTMTFTVASDAASGDYVIDLDESNAEFYDGDMTSGKKLIDFELTDGKITVQGNEHVHDPVFHAADPATCTKDGTVAYYSCSGCDKLFSDEAMTKEITSIVDKAKGHTPGETVKENIKGATCTEAGSYDNVVYCTVCKAELSRETVNEKALGHDWKEPEYAWDGFAGCEASRGCTRCDVVESESAVITSEETKSATCSAEGETTYTATFNNTVFKTQTKTAAIPIDPEAHEWDEGEITTEPTCVAKGVKTFTCKLNKQHTKTEEVAIDPNAHDWEKTVTKEATYTEDGLEHWVCKNGCGEEKDVTIPMLSHDHKFKTHTEVPATCTEDGTKAYVECELCGKKYFDTTANVEITDDSQLVIKAEGHKWGDVTKEKITEPTCGKDGQHDEVIYCTVCNAEKPDSRKTVTDLATGNHTWGTADYKWADDNSACTATHKCSVCEKEETETVDSAKTVTPPSCTEKGVITYTATFTNTAFAKQTKTVDGDPANGHTPGEAVKENVKDATCGKDGSYDEVVYCTVCSDELSRESKVIPATGEHTWGDVTKENVTEATCGKDGQHDEVIYCTVCGAEKPDSRTTVTDPATGKHSWGATVYKWSDDNSTCTATRKCSVCEKEETETANSTNKVTTEPKCEEKGVKTYTATFENAEFMPQTKTEDIDALDHDWGEITYEWAADKSSVTATKPCNRDHAHDIVETVNTTESTTATCTEDGVKTYTATFTKDVFTAQTSDPVADTAKGHSWSEVTYTWAEDNSTCTAKRTCSECDAVEEETATATAETTDADCEVAGKTVYSVSFENEEFKAQTKTVEIKALGHEWDEGKVTKEPTDTEAGEKTYTCKHNETHTKTEEIPALGAVEYTPSVTELTWKKGSTDDVAVTVNRSRDDDKTFGLFTGVTVDGETVDAANYTAEAGSLNLKLLAAYLEKLTVGDHTVKVVFTDGSADIKLTITEDAAPTPDDQNTPAPTDTDKPGDDDKPTDPGSTNPKTGAAGAAGAMLIAVAATAFVLKKRK